MKRIYSYLMFSIVIISSSSFSTYNFDKPNTNSDIEFASTEIDGLYPDYNTSPIPADSTGMQHTAVEIAADMHLGWNIGNTLEASGGETAWGNPMVTKELITAVKKAGFNAIRIPCAWNQYLSNESKAEIDIKWLNRVKEVVDYCYANNMYILLNIHWDGGWLENNCTPEAQEKNNQKQRAFWQQIATFFRDYDEHLLFASANEPNVDNATQMAVLNTYHQTCIDAVRETGGKNSYRIIVVQGPGTDFEKTNKLMTTLPVDKVPNRMMVEVHYYTPFTFCGLAEDADWGAMNYFWGAPYKSETLPKRNATWGLEDDAVKLFAMMKEQFVDKNIPVILGEYGAMRRSNLTGKDLELHLESRAYWLRYITKLAVANGCIPFYWDAGGTGSTAMGFFNRKTCTISDYQGLNALIQGRIEGEKNK